MIALLLLIAVHDESVSTTHLDVRDDGVSLTVDLGLDGLKKVVRLPAEPVELSEAQLAAVQGELTAAIGRWIRLEIDGRPAALEAAGLEPEYERIGPLGEPYIARVRQEFRVRGPARELRLRLTYYSELTPAHRALVRVTWGGRTRDYVREGPAELELAYARFHPTFWSTAGDFVGWGIEHIFIGFDHVAFLLALLVAARGAGELVKIVTSFTVAHSLTLMLAAFDVVRVDPRIAEAMIAASIVYVAVENFFLRDGRHRWILTFAFGLVHGLGFASVLRERLADLDGGRAAPILWFNAGVELGQLAIVLAVYPLLAAARRRFATPGRRLVPVASSLIFLLGMAWMGERMFGWEVVPG